MSSESCTHGYPSHLPFLLSLLCCASFFVASEVTAQMVPPLLGQGIDPYQAQVVNQTVQVFQNIELTKVLSIDVQNYGFTAMFTVYQTWVDPRAWDVFGIARVSLNVDAVKQELARTNCGKRLQQALRQDKRFNATRLGEIIDSKNCTNAKAKPQGDCKKFCNMYGGAGDGGLCCDMLWLPNIGIPNMVTTPSDRVLYDKISLVNINGLVLRETQILGNFRTPLYFRRYPLDTQKLLVLFQAEMSTGQNATFTIVPSATFRSMDTHFKVGANRTGTAIGSYVDELAGWNIDSVEFFCANVSKALNERLNQGFDPTDPIAAQASAIEITRTCAFQISVGRLSNTLVASSILPVAFIALLSFVSFFTAPHELDTRLATEITLFLALTAVQFIFRGILPTTSYLTNFDAFLLLSYVLILVIVAENIVVCYLCSRGDHKERLGGYGRMNKTEDSSRVTVDTPSTTTLEEVELGVRPEREMEKSPTIVGKIYSDSYFAYKLACQIDIVTGTVLFILYLVSAICIFTVRG